MTSFEDYLTILKEKGAQLEYLDSLYSYLADEIFGYISYDDDLSIKKGKEFYNIIDAILNQTQSKIVNSELYPEYITNLNLMQASSTKLDWGTSIRYPWFVYDEDNSWKKEEYDQMISIYNKIKEQLENEN